MNVILGKCMGGGWNGDLFFHRLREVNDIYIYISARGVLCWKNSFFFFFGFCFVHLQKEFLLCFFLVIMRPHAIPLWIFSFLLIFLFLLLFFLRLLKGIFFPLFWSSPLFSESSFLPLFHNLLFTECFLSFFLSYFSVSLIHLFLFICPLSIILFYFLKLVFPAQGIGYYVLFSRLVPDVHIEQSQCVLPPHLFWWQLGLSGKILQGHIVGPHHHILGAYVMAPSLKTMYDRPHLFLVCWPPSLHLTQLLAFKSYRSSFLH